MSRFYYPEFDAGEDGFLLLCRIINAILPLALSRTWHAFMSLSQEEKPYNSIADIKAFTGLSERKVQLDMQALQMLGLLKIIAGLKLIDGEICRVDYKDFHGLYCLAHEYYLWTQTDDYKLYQPTYEDAPRIRENPELYNSLIRFENYRRCLICKQPGPKRKRSLVNVQTGGVLP